MPSKKLTLAANDSRPVEVHWKGNFKNLRVTLDGTDVIEVANKQELQAGKSVKLPNGKTLAVGWAGAYSGGLSVELDGVPLPGSGSVPVTMVKVAAQLLAFVAILNIALGVAAELGPVEFLVRLGIGWVSAIAGGLYGVLAFGTYKRHFIALLLGVGLFAFDGIYTIFISFEYTGRLPTGGIIFRVLLLLPMIRALGPIRTLRKSEMDEPKARVVSE